MLSTSGLSDFGWDKVSIVVCNFSAFLVTLSIYFSELSVIFCRFFSTDFPIYSVRSFSNFAFWVWSADNPDFTKSDLEDSTLYSLTDFIES